MAIELFTTAETSSCASYPLRICRRADRLPQPSFVPKRLTSPLERSSQLTDRFGPHPVKLLQIRLCHLGELLKPSDAGACKGTPSRRPDAWRKVTLACGQI